MKTVDEALAFAERVYSRVSDAGIIAAEVRRLREENERLRVQLAGCGVAAMQNTADSRAHRINRDDYGWSASYADVCSAVDREISLREENERLRNDAERYRWLRESVKKSGGITKAQSYFWNYGGSRKRLDAAIDAARGAK